jgi:hypothetical protein
MHADTRRVRKDAAGPARFVTRQIAGETIIVPVCGGVGELDAIYTLNEVGSRIWQLIDTPITVGQIVETLSREYEVAAECARRDVVEFLELLSRRGLIQW